MKRIYCYFFVVQTVLSAPTIAAQVGQLFPQIKGVLLDGKSAELPLKNNKFSIVAMVFDRQAEDDLKMWLNPIYERFL